MFAAQQKVGVLGTFTQQVAMRAWAEISSQQEGVEIEKLGRSDIIFRGTKYVATKKYENEWGIIARWWFQTCFFSNLFGEDSHFD